MHSSETKSRRTAWRSMLCSVTALGLVASACGSDDDGAEPSVTVSAEAAFPVTVEHAFGSTTVDEEPVRVVSIGFTDHDVLLALGVAPIAIRQWYGDYEYVWPWAEDALGDQQPEVLPSADLNFEQIAALEPDLIIGQYIGLEQDQYDTLSKIAPTVAQPADYPSFGAPWQVMTRNIGAAVGLSAEADALVADTEALFTDARAEHPEFEGVELAYAGAYTTDGANYYVETNGSTRMGVLQDLGFVVPEELAALGTDSFYHDISAEQLELVDQQVALWEPADITLLPEIESNVVYQTLDVAVDDRDIFMTDPIVAGAMAHSTPLSLPTVLDFLLPELTRAVANIDES
ncbi:MAG: ABC transporter substrate-binding protein [Ilumatobacteraceae bacterium]